MSAKLILQFAEAETEHWIETPVLRVGKAPDCDVVIPDSGVADHTLTLEFRNGEYLVHNRSELAFEIGRRAVSPGTSLPMKDGQLLRINSDVQISLVVEGDPKPVAAPSNAFNERTISQLRSRDIDHYENAEQNELELSDDGGASNSSSTSDAKTFAQVVVILLCFAGIAGTLLIKSGFIRVTTNVPVKELLEIVRSADSPWKQRVVRQLQIADAARLRGQYEEARIHFARLRDELQSQPEELKTDGFINDAHRFVMQRLASW